MAPAMPKPALHIITSSRPNRSTASATSRPSAARVTSAAHRPGLAAGGFDLRGDGVQRSARRAQMTTAAPSRASRSAVARPIPADAPVIATTRISSAYSYQLSAPYVASGFSRTVVRVRWDSLRSA